MALPTSDDLKTLNYAYLGQPFCEIGIKSSVDLQTLDYAFEASPFMRNYVSIVILSQEESDSLGVTDSIVALIPQRQLVETDSFGVTDAIVVLIPKVIDETDSVSVADAIDTLLTANLNIVHDFRMVKLAEPEVGNKINLCYGVIDDIASCINTVAAKIYDTIHKINTLGLGKPDVENDFRIIRSWMVPGDAGFQSKGKEYIHIYISGVEITDYDADSVTINKTVNGISTASFDLARAYDGTKPTVESLVEIYYDTWKLYRGYITEITPSEQNKEQITINCSDEFWKQNQTKVYFQVGHKPTDDTELYYNTISEGIVACGASFGVGAFIPQTMSCFGNGKSEALAQLLQNAGNFGVYYDETGTPRLWMAGAGDEIWIERQTVGTNLGLYQVISHSFRESVSNIVNQYRVQMGQAVIRRFGSSGSSKKYAGYDFRTTTEYAEPDWNVSYEVLAKNSDSGYGWDYHQTEDDQYYGKVFKAFKLPFLDKELEEWTDRYEPEVNIFIPFGWECNIASGKMTEGFTIDYQGQTLTFNEPIYVFQKDSNGEVTDIRRAEIKLNLWKKKYYSKTTDPSDDPTSDISNPLMFFTEKMGTYPTTIQDSLELQGLGIQVGGWRQTGEGTSELIPSWNDTGYAKDYANWMLSKICDKKVSGEIELTLDAVCFYNISLNKRIMIDGVLENSLNVIGMSYNLSNWSVTVQLESGRYFQRSVSMQSHGE